MNGRFVGVAALLAALLWISPGTAHAQTANRLTPAEIEKGWLLLFDGETTWGWEPDNTGGPIQAEWQGAGGALSPPQGPRYWLVHKTAFRSYEVTGECWAESRRGAIVGIVQSHQSHGEPTRYSQAMIFSDGPPAAGRWVPFRLSVRPGKATLAWQGQARPETHTSGPRSTIVARPTHLQLGYSRDGKVQFRNLKLLPVGLTPIFNGKDLKGWSPVAGRASVFSVTPEGWLNVKNGNGDLHTNSHFGDFVLQLDIFSNGEHLNSGIFFRANPGSFWSGYEAQIRNQWQGEDRSKAVDFGTGGLYNLQPARRVVSSDRTWFTMTVAAHGYHIATWVNGYPVTDYTDNRPINEGDARRGARTRAGSISIQGHDPTTDLSFRNIRIADYPAVR